MKLVADFGMAILALVGMGYRNANIKRIRA